MAEDVIVLLDYIGWTGKRDVHVVGTSMGGMIAMGRLALMHTQGTVCQTVNQRTCV